LIDGEARRLKVRLLSPDRPGYGDSDPAPGRRIADFAADCEALAGWLRVATVGLIGVSGGAPYALACAERLGPRVSGLALVCPLGPIDLPETLGQMSWLTQSGFRLTRVAPALAEPLLAGPLPGLVAGLPQVLAAIRGLNTCPADREALRQGQATAILDRTIREALRQGAVGARQDLRLYTEPWGIDLAALALPIAVWHGGADRIVPPAHAHWYARHLQGAKLTLLPGEGHYSLPLRHAAAILERLVGLANP
jgi:pimeloyl-ACP methyl ester carboxylesterase